MRFVDTSFWVALAFPKDRNFGDATLLWRRQSDSLLTTNHVVGETWTMLRRRLGHPLARRFVDSIDSSTRLTILHVDEALEAEAWAWLRRHDEREYSFVDATSFAVMKNHGVFEALAFDGDFSAAGFVEVRP